MSTIDPRKLVVSGGSKTSARDQEMSDEEDSEEEEEEEVTYTVGKLQLYTRTRLGPGRKENVGSSLFPLLPLLLSRQQKQFSTILHGTNGLIRLNLSRKVIVTRSDTL